MFWYFVSFIESKLAYVIVIMSMKTIYFACLDFTRSSLKIKNTCTKRWIFSIKKYRNHINKSLLDFSTSKNIETTSISHC